MPTLSEKLKSLGVQVGAQDLPPPRKQPSYPIEEVVDGQLIDTPFGLAFAVDQSYPMDHQQGQAALRLSASLNTIASWTGDSRLLDFDPHGLVFLDTETSGLAGGTGIYAFLIGAGRFDENGFHLAQFFMRDPLEEPAQLAALVGYLGVCRGLVTFNGKAFDVPILNTRFITNGETSPLASAAHIDLLPLARRLWRDRLASRALSSLETHILGVQRTIEDVPGWLIPSIYFDYLRSGDARPLKSVFYHNAMDILSLAALLNHVASMLDEPMPGKVGHAVDMISIGKLYEDLGQADKAASLYAQGLAQDLPKEVWFEAVKRWSLMEKRRENWSIAIRLWQEAANQGEIFAHVELAKYFEHRQRDYHEALRWTQAALELILLTASPYLGRHEWLPDLEYRLARLRRKLS